LAKKLEETFALINGSCVSVKEKSNRSSLYILANFLNRSLPDPEQEIINTVKRR
jgi:hypothetical protein